jgi:hypothetical protein
MTTPFSDDKKNETIRWRVPVSVIYTTSHARRILIGMDIPLAWLVVILQFVIWIKSCE